MSILDSLLLDAWHIKPQLLLTPCLILHSVNAYIELLGLLNISLGLNLDLNLGVGIGNGRGLIDDLLG